MNEDSNNWLEFAMQDLKMAELAFNEKMKVASSGRKK